MLVFCDAFCFLSSGLLSRILSISPVVQIMNFRVLTSEKRKEKKIRMKISSFLFCIFWLVFLYSKRLWKKRGKGEGGRGKKWTKNKTKNQNPKYKKIKIKIKIKIKLTKRKKKKTNNKRQKRTITRPKWGSCLFLPLLSNASFRIPWSDFLVKERKDCSTDWLIIIIKKERKKKKKKPDKSRYWRVLFSLRAFSKKRAPSLKILAACLV